MVSDTILGAAIGVSGAVIGSALTGIFNLLSTKQRIAAEDSRRHADYFLQTKVDALNDLHAELENAYDTYKYNWEESFGMDEEEYEEKILGTFYDFSYSVNRASIFLDKSQNKTLNKVLDEFRWANGFIGRHVYADDVEDVNEMYRDFNEVEMRKAVNSARKVLENEISEPASTLETSD